MSAKNNYFKVVVYLQGFNNKSTRFVANAILQLCLSNTLEVIPATVWGKLI